MITHFALKTLYLVSHNIYNPDIPEIAPTSTETVLNSFKKIQFTYFINLLFRLTFLK